MIIFGAFLLGSHLLVKVADPVPHINVEKTCSDSASVSGGISSQNDMNSCVMDEQDARSLLQKQWAQYAPSDKNECLRASSDYLPSYVELLTCLELTKEARSLPEDQAMSANKGAR
jgi:hypothetical protein